MKERTSLISGGIGNLVRHMLSCKSSLHANIVCITVILDSVSKLFSFVYVVIASVIILPMFELCTLQLPNTGLFSCCHDSSYVSPLQCESFLVAFLFYPSLLALFFYRFLASLLILL